MPFDYEVQCCTYEIDGTFVGDSTIGCAMNRAVLLVGRRIHEDNEDDLELCKETVISVLKLRVDVAIHHTNKRCDFESSTVNAKIGTSRMGIPLI